MKIKSNNVIYEISDLAQIQEGSSNEKQVSASSRPADLVWALQSPGARIKQRFIAESRQDIHSLRGSMTKQSSTNNVQSTVVSTSVSAYHTVDKADIS